MNASGKYQNIKFGGCFIHQSPKVRFMRQQKQESCELGDLLVLVRKQTKDGVRFNAALLQLKMSDKNPARLKKDGDKKQLYIYEKWPEFEMVKSKKKYYILPKTVHQGALYCMIDKKTPWFYMAEPMAEMSYGISLGTFLYNMVKWQSGRAISDDAYSAGTDEWSRIIWDLIRASIKTVFNRKNIGCRGDIRISDVNTWKHFLKYTKIDSELLDEKGLEIAIDEDDSGISILFINIDDREKQD